MATRSRLRFALAAAAVLVALAVGVGLLLRGGKAEPRAGAAVASPAAAPPALAASPRAPDLAPLPPPPASDTTEARAPEPPVVEGRVVARETGLGIPGAEVTFSRAGAAAGARTGAGGTFRFEAPGEGRWLLAAVTAPGYLPFAPEWGYSPVAVEARAGQVVGGVELRLSAARPLVGKVLGPDGQPVAGAEVRLLGAHEETALVGLRDRFTSDAAGEFRFTAPRGAVVEANKPGFAPGRAEVDVVATVERRLAVRLRPAKEAAPPPGRIAGRVVERGTGVPVAGALVVAERQTGFGLTSVGQALSGPDGTFTLADLAEGRYRLTATAEGHARGAVAPLSPGATEAVIELPRGTRLRGCVRDGTAGGPVTAFNVEVFERRPAQARPPSLFRSFLDPSGCWAVDDVAAGPVAVEVSAPGFTGAPAVQVEVPASGEAVADVRLTRGARLRGQVVDAERRTPIEGARVALEGASGDPGTIVATSEEAWTDAQGRFELAGLPRRFSLEVTAPGHHVRLAGGLELPPGSEPTPVVIAVTPTAAGEEPRREITGIGIGIAPREGVLVVTGVVPGGGAAAAGLVPGDAIVRVDGVPISELGLSGAANAIRGPEGTSVRLSLRRGEGTLDVWVGRGIVRG